MPHHDPDHFKSKWVSYITAAVIVLMLTCFVVFLLALFLRFVW